MATHTFFNLSTPEAANFATLTSAQNDIRSAVDLCYYLKGQYAVHRPAMEIIDALSTTIVIRYCRAFPPGLRNWPWEEAVGNLNEEQLAVHERIRNYRSKHFAHSVNALEDNSVQAYYREGEEESEGIRSISCASTKMIGFSTREIDEFIDLGEVMLGQLKAMLSQENERLLAIVQRIPINELRQQHEQLGRSSAKQDLVRRRIKP